MQGNRKNLQVAYWHHKRVEVLRASDAELIYPNISPTARITSAVQVTTSSP